MKPHWSVVAAVAALGVSACSDGKRTAGICKPFSAAGAAAAPAGAEPLEVDGCLHRWSYSLAASDDDAATVAEAVLAACSAPMARWNQQALTGAATNVAPAEAQSILTGESTSPIQEHARFAEGRALFYVVQARAGNCAAPKPKERTQADEVVAGEPDR